MTPYPQLTVRIKTYDINKLTGTLSPDENLENIILQLENQTVSLPDVPGLFKHNDKITLYGKAALRLYKLIPQLNQSPNQNFLEIVHFGQETELL